MCGIAGIINLNDESRDLSVPICKMACAMTRRGPDGHGCVFIDQGEKAYLKFGVNASSSKGSENTEFPYLSFQDYNNRMPIASRLALGHTRLSIIDLSITGHQPLSDRVGKYWIVYNGEVYNFKEIKQELKSLGHQFCGNSDTEVILHSYMEWGVNCVKRFNGMFAFAVYDSLKSEIVLFRDRIGLKPLYYSIQNNQFIFASDIKTIISSGLYKPEVNWEGLWHNFSFGVAPRPATCFKNVFSIRPSSFIKIDLHSGGFIENQYWQIPVGNQDFSMTESDAIERLEELLIRSVKYRLIADVQIGSFMSGGVDSTTVSAIASRLHPGINAFTLGFRSNIARYDEIEQAKEVARAYDIRHIVELVEPTDILNHIDDMVLSYEEPYKALSPNYLISKLVKKHENKVILNGLGGDELFAGYGYYRGREVWNKSHKLRFLLKYLPGKMAKRVEYLKRLSRLKNISQFYSFSQSVFSETEKKSLFVDNFSFDSEEIIKQLYTTNTAFTDDIEALSYYDLMHYIANHHAYRVDQFTMHFSIEGRFPYLDHNIIEYSFRIPSRLKVKNGQGKYILKKIAQKYLPHQCIAMKKKGFNLPLGYWINSELSEFTHSTLFSLKQRGVFNPIMVDGILEQYTHKPEQYSKIWTLIMTELWFRRFID